MFGAGEEQLSALLAELKSWGMELESIILSRAAVAEQVCTLGQPTVPLQTTIGVVLPMQSRKLSALCQSSDRPPADEHL